MRDFFANLSIDSKFLITEELQSIEKVAKKAPLHLLLRHPKGKSVFHGAKAPEESLLKRSAAFIKK